MKRKIPLNARRAFPATPAAIVAVALAAACAAPLLAIETQTGSASAPPPLSCGVAAIERAGMVTFQPWLRAETELSGEYRFSLARAGTHVEQAGEFEVAAGARIDLSTATLPGPAHGYELRLGVTADGIEYTCRGDGTEI